MALGTVGTFKGIKLKKVLLTDVKVGDYVYIIKLFVTKVMNLKDV